MKILLTGSSGFIGTHITPLLNEKHELYHLKSDLLNHKQVQEEVASISPDIIVHLAARTEVEQSFYEQLTFSEINYVGTVNLIESAAKVKNLKNFVFASTMEVYGWQPISDIVKEGNIPETFIAFDENTQPNPNAPYAVAKYACEKYLEYALFCSIDSSKPVYVQCWVNIINNDARIITPHNHADAHGDAPAEYSYISGNISLQTENTSYKLL